jgi:hypothetical protein
MELEKKSIYIFLWEMFLKYIFYMIFFTTSFISFPYPQTLHHFVPFWKPSLQDLHRLL